MSRKSEQKDANKNKKAGRKHEYTKLIKLCAV